MASFQDRGENCCCHETSKAGKKSLFLKCYLQCLLFLKIVALCKLICMPFSNFRTHHPMEDTYGSLYTLWRKQFLACKMVCLIDFTGRTMANVVPVKTARETVNILQNHYHERLATAFLFNPPKSISSLLEGKVCRSSPILSMYLVNTMGVATSQVPRFSGNNLIQSTCTIKRTHRRQFIFFYIAKQ